MVGGIKRNGSMLPVGGVPSRSPLLLPTSRSLSTLRLTVPMSHQGGVPQPTPKGQTKCRRCSCPDASAPRRSNAVGDRRCRARLQRSVWRWQRWCGGQQGCGAPRPVGVPVACHCGRSEPGQRLDAWLKLAVACCDRRLHVHGATLRRCQLCAAKLALSRCRQLCAANLALPCWSCAGWRSRCPCGSQRPTARGQPDSQTSL